jgi:TM2 domain-containing membrane protein YozV
MDELMLMREMTDSQRMMFQSQMASVRKDKTTAILLALLLGGLGAHHFYLGNTTRGVVYILLVWTFVPSFIALIECFTLTQTVNAMNAEKAAQIAAQVKMFS